MARGHSPAAKTGTRGARKASPRRGGRGRVSQRPPGRKRNASENENEEESEEEENEKQKGGFGRSYAAESKELDAQGVLGRAKTSRCVVGPRAVPQGRRK